MHWTPGLTHRWRQVLGTLLVMANGILFGSGESCAQKSREVSTTMGPVTARVVLSPAQPVIGDTLELTVVVTSQPQVEVLMPEFGEALGRFRISDFVADQSINKAGDTELTQRYRLQSPSSGEHAIPPILIEFIDRRPGEQQSPEGLDAYELLTERMTFTVESVLVDDATEELNPPLGRIEPESAATEATTPGWIFVVFLILAAVAAGILVTAIMAYRRRVIRKSAYEIARRDLDKLVCPKADDSPAVDQFYVELSGIIRRYLENRFQLRAPELTTEEFLTKVSGSAELSHEHKRLLDDFLKHADLVKFAGLQPTGADMEQTIAKAARFLEDTRENSPLIVDPDNEQKNPVGKEEGS